MDAAALHNQAFLLSLRLSQPHMQPLVQSLTPDEWQTLEKVPHQQWPEPLKAKMQPVLPLEPE